MSRIQQRILVIDDELGPRESLRILLKNEFEVFCADSVAKGVVLLKEIQPDAVVMDIRMPGMNGIEGLREIRHIDPNVAVIMLTGFGALETAQEAIRLGANDYLKKPFDAHEMMDTIRRNLQRSAINRRRARTEKELQDLNRRLVEELATKDRMASLGQASAELVHDLRNPLTVILGYVQILGEDFEKSKKNLGLQAEEALDYIDVISSSVTRCRDLIEAWLNLTKSGRRSFKPVTVGPLVKEIVHALERLAAQRRAVVACETSSAGSVMGDRLQLARAIQNIVGNAIDALPEENGKVMVTCTEENDCVVIGVRDNGSGMSDEKLSHLFEPYFTTKPTNKGSGLGLFITHKIIEDHGGQIEVNSCVGEGTHFIMRIPRYSEVPAGA